MAQIAQRRSRSIHLPGLASAHSHAFQRALRGRTQRLTSHGDFWSWRELMYKLASGLDPDSAYRIARFAYAELALAGVTAVGEFHYVHHDQEGRPYSDRNAMATAVVEAAREVGIRIALLRVIYVRNDKDSPVHAAQKRFADKDFEHVVADVHALQQRYHDDRCVSIGLAPHSVRAVPRSWIEVAAQAASSHAWPLHMHVAEQPREIAHCLAEHGLRPVELLRELGVLASNFVAVHATHIEGSEISALAKNGSGVCICRTTERDLGDGLAPVLDMVRAGIPLSVGVDSYAISDPFEEARAVELDERSRLLRRQVALDGTALLRASSECGYAAIGMDGLHVQDEVQLNADDPALAGASDATLDDAVVFGAHPRAVSRVTVGGRVVVDGGEISGYQDWLQAFEQDVKALC